VKEKFPLEGAARFVVCLRAKNNVPTRLSKNQVSINGERRKAILKKAATQGVRGQATSPVLADQSGPAYQPHGRSDTLSQGSLFLCMISSFGEHMLAELSPWEPYPNRGRKIAQEITS